MSLKLNIPEYGVTQFNRELKDLIEDHYSYVRIKGEISEIRVATKGQLYLTLKDEKSILSAVVWEQKKRSLTFEPEMGMEVTLTGRITTWSKFKTTYQIDVDKIEIAGEGALLKIIEERKKRLSEKGYFDDENKKQIPYLPSRIGVITSPNGSVIHDIINRISDRFKTPIDLWPVAVQGTEAAKNIIDAINGFNKVKEIKPDVIIIARGGGSTEDLMAFNDEKLAEVVSKSHIPIISAIGHETDTTIIDFVSDLRASTPTAAAELVVPVRSELINNIKVLKQRLNYGIENLLKQNSTNIYKLSSYIKTPEQIIQSFKDRLIFINTGLSRIIKNNIAITSKDFYSLSNNLKISSNLIKFNKSNLKNLSYKFHSSIKRELKNNKEKYISYLKLIETNSINSNLKKGYSIISKGKKIIHDSKLIRENDTLNARLIDKTIEIKWYKNDGDSFSNQDIICEAFGPIGSLLTGERTALNFIQLLSGVSTKTKNYINACKDSNVKILDSRKTIPGLRIAEKYAVNCGGGTNHRLGLFDNYLIKENHINAAGNIEKIIDLAGKQAYGDIIVEVENIEQLKIALKKEVDRVLLDNFSKEEIIKAIKIRDAYKNKYIYLEASGGITIKNIYSISSTGIDYISVGSLTKDIEAIDFTMLINS